MKTQDLSANNLDSKWTPKALWTPNGLHSRLQFHIVRQSRCSCARGLLGNVKLSHKTGDNILLPIYVRSTIRLSRCYEGRNIHWPAMREACCKRVIRQAAYSFRKCVPSNHKLSPIELDRTATDHFPARVSCAIHGEHFQADSVGAKLAYSFLSHLIFAEPGTRQLIH